MSTYIRTVDKNPSIDFIVSKFDDGVLKLLLVDITLGISYHVLIKNNKFLENIPTNSKFK